jgi:protein-tyrosine-phosphatase
MGGTCVSAVLSQTPQTVLFVCEHGAAKSVVAAAHFNRLAADRGLPFRAVSRGTAPDATVPTRITEGLRKEQLSVPEGFTPTEVLATDVAGATRIVTFDVTLPTTPESAKLRHWDGLPAFSDGYDPASRAIVGQVEALIRELEEAVKKKPNAASLTSRPSSAGAPDTGHRGS